MNQARENNHANSNVTVYKGTLQMEVYLIKSLMLEFHLVYKK
jgi:hypothetical protein